MAETKKSIEMTVGIQGFLIGALIDTLSRHSPDLKRDMVIHLKSLHSDSPSARAAIDAAIKVIENPRQ
jgi:hypothetical protein